MKTKSAYLQKISFLNFNLNNKWVLLIILALIWGSSFILIKKSLISFSWLEVGALRVAIAGLILLPVGIKSLQKIPKNLLFWVFMAGLLGNFLPMFLFPLGEEKISSGMAGILNSLVPIFVVIIGFLFFGTKSSLKQVLGTVIGFIGAAVLVLLGNNFSIENVLYAGYIVLATICYAINGLMLKRYLNDVPSLQLSSAVFSIWFLPSVLILVFSNFFISLNNKANLLEGFTYVGILGILGTAMAMILFYRLISKTSVVFTASVTYLMPVVAVLWGVYFMEELTLWHLIGGVLILIGVYLLT